MACGLQKPVKNERRLHAFTESARTMGGNDTSVRRQRQVRAGTSLVQFAALLCPTEGERTG